MRGLGGSVVAGGSVEDSGRRLDLETSSLLPLAILHPLSLHSSCPAKSVGRRGFNAHVYPAPLNPNISWAECAAYGRPLHSSHDVHLMRQREISVPVPSEQVPVAGCNSGQAQAGEMTFTAPTAGFSKAAWHAASCSPGLGPAPFVCPSISCREC